MTSVQERRKAAGCGSRRLAPAVAAIVGLGLGLLAGRAVASSAAFSFVMELRAVLGEKNHRVHALDAGELTFSGAVWVVSKSGGSTSTPESVTIRVRRSGLVGSDVCVVSVTPSTIFNAKTSFEKSCGHIEAGSYWIDARKSRVDGWHIKGDGTLVTK